MRPDTRKDPTDASEAPSLLRIAARIVIALGAVGSLALMFYVGRYNRSVPLLLLFAVWVLSPFVLLFVADRVSRPWPAPKKAVLHIVTLLLALGSLATYGTVALTGPAKPAFWFLVVPVASWFLVIVGAPIASALTGRSSG